MKNRIKRSKAKVTKSTENDTALISSILEELSSSIQEFTESAIRSPHIYNGKKFTHEEKERA
jgi:hypothetical protein